MLVTLIIKVKKTKYRMKVIKYPCIGYFITFIFDRFPSDNVEREKWIKAIPNSNLSVTKYTVICELHWPPNFEVVTVRGGKHRPKNAPSVWLGVPLSQIPTANPTQRTTKRSLSGIRNSIDDELDTFLKRDKVTFWDIKNKFLNVSDHQYPVISFMIDGYVVIQSSQFFNGIPFFVLKIYENLTFETFYYGVKCNVSSLTVNRIMTVDTWSKFDEKFVF